MELKQLVQLYNRVCSYTDTSEESCRAWLHFEKELHAAQEKATDIERKQIKDAIHLEGVDMICSGIKSAGLDKKNGLTKP